MKQLRKDLNAAMKELKALTRKTDQFAKKLDKLGKTETGKKPKMKREPVKKAAIKKPAKPTAIETVFAVVKSSKKGVDPATLRKKTGFDKKKVWNNINMLKKKGKIKSVQRGIYVKV